MYTIGFKTRLTNGQRIFLNASSLGNVARFSNHSCKPNCTLVEWIQDRLPIFVMTALCDIKAGEKLTWAYAKAQNFTCGSCDVHPLVEQ